VTWDYEAGAGKKQRPEPNLFDPNGRWHQKKRRRASLKGKFRRRRRHSTEAHHPSVPAEITLSRGAGRKKHSRKRV